MERRTPTGLERVGCEDINYGKVVPRLTKLFRDVRAKLGWENMKLKGIYICGSYARDEAFEVASDLDVRYVVENFNLNYSQEEAVRQFRDTAKNIWKDKYSKDNDTFVLIDAWFGIVPPESESVRVV
jgi:predicted nucleotidyltransferase